MSPTTFDDIGKTESDLFEKQFDTNTRKFEVDTQTAKGVNVVATLKASGKDKQSVSVKHKWAVPAWKADMSAELATPSDLKFEASFKNVAFNGLKVKLNADTDTKKSTATTKATLEFTNEKVNLKNAITLPTGGSNLKLSSGNTFKVNDSTEVGVKADVSVANGAPSLNGLSAAAQVKRNDAIISLFGRNLTSKLGVGASLFQYSSRIGGDVGVYAFYDTKNEQNPLYGRLTTRFVHSDSTTKFRFDNNLAIGVSYTRKFAGANEFTVAGDLSSSSPALGYTLKLKD